MGTAPFVLPLSYTISAYRFLIHGLAVNMSVLAAVCARLAEVHHLRSISDNANGNNQSSVSDLGA